MLAHQIFSFQISLPEHKGPIILGASSHEPSVAQRVSQAISHGFNPSHPCPMLFNGKNTNGHVSRTHSADFGWFVLQDRISPVSLPLPSATDFHMSEIHTQTHIWAHSTPCIRVAFLSLVAPRNKSNDYTLTLKFRFSPPILVVVSMRFWFFLFTSDKTTIFSSKM